MASPVYRCFEYGFRGAAPIRSGASSSDYDECVSGKTSIARRCGLSVRMVSAVRNRCGDTLCERAVKDCAYDRSHRCSAGVAEAVANRKRALS